MRIKCPNSDIVLELPGDRTDMKFTCPACHRVHRVTVSITTPGEDPPPPRASSNTRSVAKVGPQMPKKYATGAYAPVVDIPIDANFVLLDPSAISPQPGIDLGAATQPPPRFDRDLSSRKTEIIDRRDSERRREEARTREPSPREAWSETVSEAGSVRADTEETTREREGGNAGGDKDEAPPPPPPPRSAMDDDIEEDDDESSDGAGRSRIVRNTFLGLLLALVAAGCYLGWQQYQYNRTRERADHFLSWADRAWREGDVRASASAAREASDAIQSGGRFHTAVQLYNRIAESTGWFSPLPSPSVEAERRIKAYLDREAALTSFRDSLDASSAREMAGLLREVAPTASADPSLGAAMEKIVADAALEQLNAEGDSLSPEEARARAADDRDSLLPVLSQTVRAGFENELSAFADKQRRRLAAEVGREVASVAGAARSGDEAALERYRALAARIRDADVPEIAVPMAELAGERDSETLGQLEALARLVARAEASARTVLSRPDDEDDDSEADRFVEQARSLDAPNPKMAAAAVKAIEATRAVEDDLLGLRVELYGRLQSEMRRNRDYPGTRMAWAMLRSTFDDPAIQINPRGFRYDTAGARMEFILNDLHSVMEMTEDDYEKRIRAEMGGYRFSGGWAVLFHKPMLWMADLAAAMRKAGVNPLRHAAWEVLEGPGGPLAVSMNGVASGQAVASPGEAAREVFFQGRLRTVSELPAPADARAIVDDFRTAARELEEAVMGDDGISPALRQALKPVLMGTYQTPDPRDYFDSAFCRRLIEADYLETYLNPMPAAVGARLDAFRRALGKVEAGYDEFSVELDDGSRLFAVARVEADVAAGGVASDQDPETGETLPRYTWRIERDASTVFFSPLPSRFVYAFMLAEHYPGRHRARPAGVPVRSEIWHATRGMIASYEDGAAHAVGDEELWNQAIAEDSSGRFDPTIGPPGWNFPLHVLQRDDQGDPVRLAILGGVVESPDFSGMVDEDQRRRAENEWLDHTAATLSAPGELGLIFHQFFRYCSDSPLPELPNLIGSHFGLSDTHQTVYESLERRWVGRLIGDCDDLAEFFQELTRRQGKLSHVMQLPGHAAAGYVEPLEDGGGYRFVVLQTGPVLQFVAPTLNDVVELAYRSFDRGDGISHMTTDAVPLLLRFADEETRTPFVLSARIYGDAEYAERMIQVQAYWHEHVYSAAIDVMEGMVADDPEIGSIKELGSLYERVGFYDRSEEMRRREQAMVSDNVPASLSTLLEIAQLHFQDKDRAKALEALGEMEALMQRLIRQDDAPGFFGAMTFRSYWAMYLARLGQPDRAWNLVRYDATMTKRQLGSIADPVLRTMVVLYDRMAMMRDAAGGSLSGGMQTAMGDVRRELEEAFGRGYFKGDDSYNNIISRYFVLGRYAVADMGRAQGLELLRRDGPYPAGPKDHTRRSRGIAEDDWPWFRISPQLYLAVGMEMLDEDEYPELYDPAGARPLLEDVSRAAEKGRGLGSDVAGGDDVTKAALTLSFLNNDLAAFRAAMTVVKDKDYSSLYDDAAMTFGLNCGLVPLSAFPAWCEAFREFFPGSQHYFKVVYRAIDKEHYDHALVMAEASVRFFPDHELLQKEAEFVRSIIPDLKARKYNRTYRQSSGVPEEIEPAA